MSRQTPFVGRVLAAVLIASTGCGPQQPFYLRPVDNELAHYKGVATEIEYPDVEPDRLAEVAGAQKPFSLANRDPKNFWEVSLEEAMQIALNNNKVMRNIGGQIQGPPDFLLRNPEAAPTMYGPALAEANPRTGPEAALAAFDAQWVTSLSWLRGDAPQNVNPVFTQQGFFASISEHDQAKFQTQLQKVTATGGQFSLTHNLAYDSDRFPYGGTKPYAYPTSWNVNLEAQWRQPLLQGAGVQFNRIAGPGAQPGLYNGVVIARIRSDIALADFEASLRNLVSDVENAYWELYFAYRNLDAANAGSESALVTWRKVETLQKTSGKGGEADKESQARQQYFLFRSAAERALSALYAAESKLRYMLGLAATDGRLIRPKDEPSTAKVAFDWCEILSEGLTRSVELREQKWIVKQREMELIAAKNFLLPKVDFVALYRWLGIGNRLDGGNEWPDLTDPALPSPLPDSNAYRTMTNGEFQEWQLGVQATIPLGFRREMAGVRHAQLSLVQEQTKLQEGELELSHQLAFAVREVEANHVLSGTNFNRRVAAQREVEAVTTAYETGTITIDRVLDAQQKLAQAESDYYRSLVDYAKSIAQVHFRKGSLLEYNGVYLAEGPWPGKAYFDARRRARARAASTYLDYGFTQPRIVSRGPIEQQPGGSGVVEGDQLLEAAPVPNPSPAPGQPELVPTPAPLPAGAVPAEPPEAPQPVGEPRLSVTGNGGKQRGWTAATRTASAPVARTAGRQATAEDGVAAAQPTQGREAAAGANSDRTNSVGTGSGRASKSPNGWTAVEKASYNEPVANPPPASLDRTASGWKGVNR